MAQTLQQRMIAYEESTSQRIISRIPVIIKIDGWSFSRVTKNLPKPFCHKTMAMLNGTMISLVKQIDGAVFGYQYSDKIIIGLVIISNLCALQPLPWQHMNL
jgi:tRNA(His) guanylyltransferase